MSDKAKKFIADARKLGIKVYLSPQKTHAIFEPGLPSDMVLEAIKLQDDFCSVLADEERLLSPEEAELIRALSEVQPPSDYKLTDTPVEDNPNAVILYEEMTPESFDRDFDYIRKNLKDIIRQGSRALERMLAVAEASQHPRAYEVVATLMKTLVDANKDLLSSHKQKIETNQLNGVQNNNSTTNIQNNNIVFTGSTSDLAKLLKQKKD
jgi:fructose-specific phosphotransferase system component IIB